MNITCAKFSIAALTVGGMLSISSCSNSAPAAYTLSGAIPGIKDSTKVVLVDEEAPDSLRVLGDTMLSAGDSFCFTGSLAGPRKCSLKFQRFNKHFNSYINVASLQLMLDNGETTISTEATLDSLRNSYQPELLVDIQGGEAQRQYMEYYNAVAETELAARKAGYLQSEKYFATNNNPDTMKLYVELQDEAEAKYADVEMDFIKNHPAYHISAYKVWEKLAEIYTRTPEQLDELAAIVSVCPDTARVGRINRRLEASRKHALGIPAKDFTMTTVDGDTVSFTSKLADGKYNFVDFWASWCGPCRAAIPHVKELKDKYGDRLNVMSISADENRDDWVKAMNEEGMTWAQYHLDGKSQMSDAIQAYMISSIPRLLLFGPDGKLVCSTNLPDEVTAYLEENM